MTENEQVEKTGLYSEPICISVTALDRSFILNIFRYNEESEIQLDAQ